MRLLITGGAGFIGSALLCHPAVRYPQYSITVLDALTYAGAIVRPSKQGLGSAYREGFGFAIRDDCEYIGTRDADVSHDPLQLESLVKAALHADVVLGSR
jgi:nucleoside-diphosphate-sugar epimerase